MIMAEKIKTKKARFKYNIPSDYKLVYANGVYGGITTRGELLCNFFFESLSIPEEEEAEVMDDGKVKMKEKEPEEVILINRDLKVGILLSPEQALTIANWMLEKIKSFESQRTREEGGAEE